MNQLNIIILISKGLAVWMALSVLVLYSGEWLLSGLFPLIRNVITLMTSELSPSLKLIKLHQFQWDASIELTAKVLKPIYLNAGQYIPSGMDLKASAHLLHVLVPVVIEWTILLVWPLQYWSQRLLLFVLGLFAAALLVIAILPAQLLGTLEISLQNVALTGAEPRPAPWFVAWMVFCEMGGRWLLGLVAAGLCIQLQRKLFWRVCKTG
ncbi:hypothetical protein [Methylomonas sp. AM2-LC]|uniref:hypothetical protein n=1 Tax=Methylomonas sp. AM2-LC TaxID=3153301 RepID=UPI0032662DAD